MLDGMIQAWQNHKAVGLSFGKNGFLRFTAKIFILWVKKYIV